jgi:hypothetical protein
MSREQALKAANLIADCFDEVGFCDDRMIDLFADRIEEVYGNENAMSLRDLFATQALAGLLAAGDHDNFTSNAIAKDSYVIAHAMLRARGES